MEAKLQSAHKAWVAATVTFVGVMIGVYLGTDIPLDLLGPWLTGMGVSATSGLLTYVVPNQDRPAE